MALGHQPLDKGRGLPDIAVACLVEALDCLQYLGQPRLVGPEHRPAAIDREAVAIDIGHIDVGGAQRDAFLENLRPLVDQRQNAAIDDLLRIGLVPRFVLLEPFLFDDCRDLWVGQRGAAAFGVAVETGAGLTVSAASTLVPATWPVRLAIGAAGAIPSARITFTQGLREESLAALRKSGVDVTDAKALEQWTRDNPEAAHRAVDRAFQRSLANYLGSLSGNIAAERFGELIGFGVDQGVENSLKPGKDKPIE